MSQNKERVCVRDVMKEKVDFVDGLTTVSEAIQSMQHVATKCLIVNKRDDHDEYGMVLISDVALKVLAKDRAPERINIYEIMSKPVLSIRPDMDIRYAARLLERFKLSRAPVVEQDKVIGIVSLTDMVLKGVCRKKNV
jgi:CBS domain-containing protein